MQLMTVGCSPYFVATSTPSWTCVPSCSCVSTLPMSCSSAPRFASWTSSFSSEEHTSELQSHSDLRCRLLLQKKTKFVHMSDDQASRVTPYPRRTPGLPPP